MSIKVDAETCVGCGLCESNCPEVFMMEDDNLAHVIAQSCDQHDLKDVASQCPVESIKVE